MKSFVVMMAFLVLPAVVFAGNKVDFEIHLIAVGSQIDQFPLTTELSFFARQDIGTIEFINRKIVTLSEEETDQLNQSGVLPGKDLKLSVSYDPISFQEQSLADKILARDSLIYVSVTKDGAKRMQSFDVSVRTDAWGSSTHSGKKVMEMMREMVNKPNITEMKFSMEDDGVHYIFSVRRLTSIGKVSAKHGDTNERSELLKIDIVQECDGTCVIRR